MRLSELSEPKLPLLRRDLCNWQGFVFLSLRIAFRIDENLRVQVALPFVLVRLGITVRRPRLGGLAGLQPVGT